MPQPTDSTSPRTPRGLILDFAGVLTADPRSVHRAWCESEGLRPEAWRATLNDSPEGRRLYAALEVGQISQADWNEGTAALLGAHVDPENLPDAPEAYGAMITRAKAAPGQSRSTDRYEIPR